MRFIGNYSTGKMGFALAEECAIRGAEVILIAGPVSLTTSHPNIKRIDVESADEMFEATIKEFPQAHAAILCAAVADFKPVSKSDEKIKREKENLIIELKPNKDIAAYLGKIKEKAQILIGFALETNEEEQNALKKLAKKNLDFIVLNSLKDTGAGFGHNTNKISILSKDGQRRDFPLKPKKEVASDIVNETLIRSLI